MKREVAGIVSAISKAMHEPPDKLKVMVYVKSCD